MVDGTHDGTHDGTPGDSVSPVRAALAVRDFRVLWLSTFGSQIGTWMQTVILAAFVFDATGDPMLTSLVTFSNVIPQLLFALPGGVLADLFDRKRLVYLLTMEQLVGSLVIAWIVRTDDFSQVGLFLAVFVVGTGAALEGPVLLAAAPTLVPRDRIPGVVALTSGSLNASRVVGPAIGALLYVAIGASWVFVLNAATFLVIFLGVSRVRFPDLERGPAESMRDRLVGGFRFVRSEPVVWRALLSILLFGVLCTGYMGIFPPMAENSWGVPAKSTAYGLLYATWGAGATFGSFAVGTFLARFSIERVVRLGMFLYGVSLALWISVGSWWSAFPLAFLAGFVLVVVVTSIATVFQGRLSHEVRGRASAIWLMFFIGSSAVCGLLSGWLAAVWSVKAVIYAGAAIAVALVWFVDLRPPHQRRTIRDDLLELSARR